MKHDDVRTPGGTARPATGGVLPARDALSLRIQVEALLLDPRGSFRPRPVTLRPAGAAGADDLLVMQVAEQADGSISVVTSEPLQAGQVFVLGGDGRAQEHPGRAHGHGHEYLLLDCRPGNRPEDGGQACWISVLRPQTAAPATAGGAASPADGA